MKHKIFIGWVITFIFTLFLTLIFNFLFGFSVALALMVPIEVGVFTSAIPVIIIDQKIDVQRSAGDKNKLKKKISKKIIKDQKSLERANQEIQIIGEEELKEEPIKILVGDVKVLEMPDKTSKPSLQILKENFSNVNLLEIFEKNESLEDVLKALKDFNLTIFSNEFFEKMDEMKWSEKEKLDFICDMITFTPKEREEILLDIIDKT